MRALISLLNDKFSHPLSSVLKLTTTSQLAAFYTSPYYSSYSDSVKASLTKLSNGQTLTTSTSGSDLIKFNMISLIATVSMTLYYIL